MVQSFTEDFQVVWKDPADAELHWNWDTMHNPRPMPALAHDVGQILGARVFSSRMIAVNGYAYGHGFTIPFPPPEVFQRGVLEVWENEYVPLIRQACAVIRTADYESMTATDLADSLERVISDASDVFRYTMIVAIAFGMPTNQLVDFCEGKLGSDGAQLAGALLQGYDNMSAAAGAGLGGLAETASGLPEVAAALRKGWVEGLESVAGGQEFLARFLEYLDEYGWRVSQWGLIHLPTWAEDPRIPLMLISRYLTEPGLSPALSIERAVRTREEATREIESRLNGADLDQFKSMLAACQTHVRISEGRAFWQLTIDGSLRVPCLALGRKLVDSGVLEKVEDVFFLDLEELRQVAREPISQAATVSARKSDLRRWEGLSPPAFIGAGPDADGAPPEMQRARARFWGGEIAQPDDKKLIKGHAASRGVARGRARIIRELSGAGELQRGEILVCQSTAPPWTPLFAIAAAVVTDAGGILSHSAICAREFGIPCVVGTQVATQQIPDGAMITVDGGEGIVRIEG